MAAPQEKLAASLAQLESLQKTGRRIFRSTELTRVHRERLLKAGFLREVMKGWVISSSPEADPGDSTPWLASFWEFCAQYCAQRFRADWHLSPEQSLLLHGERTAIPKQVIIYSSKGTNNNVELPFGTSLYDLKQKAIPPAEDLTERDGLRLLTPAAGLIKVPAAFFLRHPVEAQLVLSQLGDPSGILRRLLAGGHSTVAGWLAGAFRRIGRGDEADEILAAMKAVGYDVRETDPFAAQQPLGTMGRSATPIVGRLKALWEASRVSVIAAFPPAPGLPADGEAYLRLVDGIYQSDAYHSLSIEGYRVTTELIERVRTGQWDPLGEESDRQTRDALAARGYWQAFQLVRATVADIVVGAEASRLVQQAHRAWYRELFQPCVAAGMMPASALAGYRNGPVYLRGSRHVPPRSDAVPEALAALFDLLAEEPQPSVRAVLGHWLFGYIHPFPDGNGRIARFLMNAMLASGGYPWTVIAAVDRCPYLAALEQASTEQDVAPFADFLAQRVGVSLERPSG